MKIRSILTRLLALLLTLLLLPSPLANALSVEQAKELLERYYIDAIPEDVFEHATIEEIIQALGDPYTQYLSAEEYRAFLDTINDSSIVGIGITLRMEEQGGRIITVHPGSPAADAGLAADDLIVEIDGVNLAGVSDALPYLQGESGTVVTLRVRKADGTERSFRLVRRQVTIVNTVGALTDGHIGRISCSSFGNETYGHFRDIIRQYDSRANLWIIDLRGNGGGMTQAAADAAACFIGNSIMSYFQDRSGSATIQVPTASEVSLTEKPAIILVDEATASAAELFSGAMRDYNRALIIGTRTYGKGVAQAMLDQNAFPDHFPDGDALKVTAYRFFAPYCATNDKLGILPTLLVDKQYTEQVATLLAEQEPEDSNGYFRLDLCGMTFYIKEETACSPEQINAFRELLFAIPPAATFYWGTGGASWMTSSPEDTALLTCGSLDSRTFDDVQSSPYRNAIQTLAVYGIAAPVDGSQYHPNAPMTRGDLCMMLDRLMNHTAARTVSFPDVPANTELSRAVSAVHDLGLVEGYGDGYFRPNQPITHQEFLSVMARAAAFLELNASYYYQMEAAALPLDDSALRAYANWARRSAWLNSYLGILWADVEDIAPKAVTTREEAAASLCALLQFCGLVPTFS